MHGKERVIAPLLEHAWQAEVRSCGGLDTDQFGTFTREVPREGTPLEAARRKIDAAEVLEPQVDLLIASEGSFGPHPQIPFAAQAIEIVLLRSRASGLEVVGRDVSLETNFAFRRVTSAEDALAFATGAGFPEHGVVLMPCEGREPAPGAPIIKNVGDRDQLLLAARDLLRQRPAIWLETDMRAHRNPTRMRAIARATQDLLDRVNSRCPRCRRPGFTAVERIGGLGCRRCGAPTRIARAERWACAGCRHDEERTVEHAGFADPANCDHCNP